MKAFSKTLLITLLTLLLIGSSSAPTFGQGGNDPVSPPDLPGLDLRFQHLTTDDGLSEGRVWGITQDRQGFMWFATWDGLNRYDGYEFKVYKEELGNPNTPGGTEFWSVHGDQDGMIWAASHTGGGLSRFDPTTEQWRRYKHDPDDPHSLSNNSVQAILEDRMGILWVGTQGGGLNRFEGETEAGLARFTRYPTDPEDPFGTRWDYVPRIYEDRSGELWIGTFGGLNRYDRENETFIHYSHDPDDPTSLSDNRIREIYVDHSGVLWVGTWGGGLNRFDRETQTFTHYRHDPDEPHSLSSDVISAIIEDRSGVMWIGTWGGGLNRYDRETDSFVAYQHNSADARSLGNNSVTTLFVDQIGILWIGTAGGGIDRLNPYGQGFALTQHKPTDPNSLNNNDVRTVLEDQAGDLWIGTWDGLNHYDPETDSFTHYLHDPDDPKSISNNRIWVVLEDREGVLWVGTNNGGLNRLERGAEDESATRFTHFRHDPANPHSLSQNGVTALYEDTTGVLWVGTWGGGLNALDRQSEDGQVRFRRYQHDPEDTNSLGHGQVWAIHEDPKAALWIGVGGGGLCRFDRESETFACYKHNPEDEHSLSSNTVWVIHQDGDGTLWVGTSAGLNQFNPQTGKFTHYTTVDGLPHDTVVGILEEDVSPSDIGGDLWLSTLGGLSRFDPQLGTFHNYDASDGLQGNRFQQNAAFKTSEGKIFFGGQRGLTSFYPEDIQVNPSIPPVHVISFALDNEPVLIGGDSPLHKSIIETEQLELSYDDRVISFQFAALAYASSEKNRYRYKLEGFDKEWTEVGSDRRFVTYTNLDPGDYTFRVLGSNEDGVWNEQGTSITITITPPWWGTWWFRGGMLLLLAGLVVGGFVWQRNSGRRRERQLETLVEERTQELLFAQDQIEAMFNASQVGICLTTYDGKFLAANDTLRKMAAYPSLEEFLQRNASEFYADPGQREEMLNQVSRSGSAQMTDLEFRKRDGQPLHAILSVNEVQRRGDKILLSMIEDITERVEAEEELRASRQFVRSSLDALTAHMAIVDQSGTIIGINDAWGQFALDNQLVWPDGGLGQNYLVTVDTVTGDDAKSARQAAAGIRAVIAGERDCFQLEYPCHSPTEERWFVMHVTRFESNDGVRAVIAHEDITRRKQAELALQQSNQSLSQRLEELSTLNLIAQTVSKVTDLPDALDIVVAAVTNVFEAADASLVLLSGTNSEIEVLASFNRHFPVSSLVGKGETADDPANSMFRGMVLPTEDSSLTQELLVDGQSVVIPDAQVDPRLATARATLQTRGVQSLLLAPLLSHGDVIGIMSVSSDQPGHEFTRDEVLLAETISGQIASAIETARLFEQVEQGAVAEERNRLARELHDSATQSLYSATLLSEAGQELAESGDLESAKHYLSRVSEVIHQALKDMRLLVFQMRPPELDTEGLVGALQRRLDAVEKRAGIEARLISDELPTLPDDVVDGLYGIAQEALNNVLKHAEADTVSVTIRSDGASVNLEVVDDGRGFDIEAAHEGGGMGLTNMQERAAQLSGELTIDTAPGQGTKLKALVGNPMTSQEPTEKSL